MKYYYTKLQRDYNGDLYTSIILRDQDTNEEQEVDAVYNSFEANRKVLQLQKELDHDP